MTSVVVEVFTRNEGLRFMGKAWTDEYRKLHAQGMLELPSKPTNPELCASTVVDRVKSGWYTDNNALADDVDTVVNNAHAYILSCAYDESELEQFKQDLKGMRITIRTRIRNSKVRPAPAVADADGAGAAAAGAAAAAAPVPATPNTIESSLADLLCQRSDVQSKITDTTAALHAAETDRASAATRLEELEAVDTSGIDADKAEANRLKEQWEEMMRRVTRKEKGAKAKLRAAEDHFRASRKIEVVLQKLDKLREEDDEVKDALEAGEKYMAKFKAVNSRKHNHDDDDNGDEDSSSGGPSGPEGKKRRVESP